MVSLTLRSSLLFCVIVPPLAFFYIGQSLESHGPTGLQFLTNLMLLAFMPPSEPRLTKDLVTRSLSTKPEFERTVIAVGDLHGDYNTAIEVLKMSGVINAEGDWSGKVDFFVQLGDIIDRGDDTILLFRLMRKLREQAAAHGAVMVNLFGNHEIMNAAGNWRYVSSQDIATFGTKQHRWEEITMGNIGEDWAESFQGACRLPLHPSIGELNDEFRGVIPHHTDFNPSFPGQQISVTSNGIAKNPILPAALAFVHGGLSPNYPDLLPFPTGINRLSKKLIRKLQSSKKPLFDISPDKRMNVYRKIKLSQNEYMLLQSDDAPFWYRGWALGNEDSRFCARARRVLAETGTRHMIMGHTVTPNRIVSKCKGKIIIIDTGMSWAFQRAGLPSGVQSALEIKFTLNFDGINEYGQKRWKEKEVITPIYPNMQAKPLFESEREIVGEYGIPTSGTKGDDSIETDRLAERLEKLNI